MNFESELLQLKRRVEALEGAFSVLTTHFADVHPQLLALRAETVARFEAAETQAGRVMQRLDTMNSQVWSLRDDLPMLLRDALRRTDDT